MLLNEPLGFWVEEREGAPEERQGYLFCNLQKEKKKESYIQVTAWDISW